MRGELHDLRARDDDAREACVIFDERIRNEVCIPHRHLHGLVPQDFLELEEVSPFMTQWLAKVWRRS